MKLLKNLLPEDTRIVEIISAISLVFIGILIWYGQIRNPEFEAIQNFHFWTVYTFISGLLQFISILFYPKLELLRSLSSLVAGSLLLWFGLIHIKWDFEISEISTICLGIANLYGFIVNTVQMRHRWEI